MLPRRLTCLAPLLLLAAMLTSPLAAQTKNRVETAAPAAASGTTEQTAANFTKYEALVVAITIFVLAIFVGYEVINKVPTTLHTPLMSGSNAISGITVVGAIIVGGFAIDRFSSFPSCSPCS